MTSSTWKPRPPPLDIEQAIAKADADAARCLEEGLKLLREAVVTGGRVRTGMSYLAGARALYSRAAKLRRGGKAARRCLART